MSDWKPSQFGQYRQVYDDAWSAGLDVHGDAPPFEWTCCVYNHASVSLECKARGTSSSVERAKDDAEAAMRQITLEFPYMLRGVEAVTRHP